MKQRLECEVIYKDGTTEILKDIINAEMINTPCPILRIVFEEEVTQEEVIPTRFDDIVISNVKKFSFSQS